VTGAEGLPNGNCRERGAPDRMWGVRRVRLTIGAFMRRTIRAVARWWIWRLSGGWAFLILFGAWFGLSWILGPVSNTAYALSILVAFFGPTALFSFLFVRHWLLRDEAPRCEGLARRIGCIIACGVTTWLAVATALAYAGMNDAPRGLLWDFNIVTAPIIGMVAMQVTRYVVHAASAPTRKRQNQRDGQ